MRFMLKISVLNIQVRKKLEPEYQRKGLGGLNAACMRSRTPAPAHFMHTVTLIQRRITRLPGSHRSMRWYLYFKPPTVGMGGGPHGVVEPLQLQKHIMCNSTNRWWPTEYTQSKRISRLSCETFIEVLIHCDGFQGFTGSVFTINQQYSTMAVYVSHAAQPRYTKTPASLPLFPNPYLVLSITRRNNCNEHLIIVTNR